MFIFGVNLYFFTKYQWEFQVDVKQNLTNLNEENKLCMSITKANNTNFFLRINSILRK